MIESQQVLEWMAQAEAKARRDDLRVLLEDRFGPLPEALVQQIEAIQDTNRLRNAIRQVNHLQNLSDLQL